MCLVTTALDSTQVTNIAQVRCQRNKDKQYEKQLSNRRQKFNDFLQLPSNFDASQVFVKNALSCDLLESTAFYSSFYYLELSTVLRAISTH